MPPVENPTSATLRPRGVLLDGLGVRAGHGVEHRRQQLAGGEPRRRDGDDLAPRLRSSWPGGRIRAARSWRSSDGMQNTIGSPSPSASVIIAGSWRLDVAHAEPRPQPRGGLGDRDAVAELARLQRAPEHRRQRAGAVASCAAACRRLGAGPPPSTRACR